MSGNEISTTYIIIRYIYIYNFAFITIYMKVEESFLTNLMKLYVIILIQKGPKHGYEIIDELERLIGKKPSAGQIYPLLKKLQKKGYVEVIATGGRQKKVYRLTREGRKLFASLTGRFSDLIDIAIEPKLTRCMHCGCSVYKGGYKEKIKSKILMFCCCHCAKSYRKKD